MLRPWQVHPTSMYRTQNGREATNQEEMLLMAVTVVFSQ